MWGISEPEIKPTSPASAGRFLSTVPPGKSGGGMLSCFYDEYYWLIPTHMCISSPLQLEGS